MVYELLHVNCAWTIIVLYHPKVEQFALHGCRQGGFCTEAKTAKLLGKALTEKEIILQGCENEEMQRYQHLKRAGLMPPTKEEKTYFPEHKLRRCPSCLAVVPTQATKCFYCWGIFLTKDFDAWEENEMVSEVDNTKDYSCRGITPRRRGQDQTDESTNAKIPMYKSRKEAMSTGDATSLDECAVGKIETAFDQLPCLAQDQTKRVRSAISMQR
jgi:hypothetical protein